MQAALTLLLVFLSLATVAYAGEATVSWTNPTTNTDGSAIPATGPGSLTGTRVEWGSCSGTAFGTKAGEVSVAAGVSSVVVPNLAPATYCFRAFSKNTYNVESAASNVASKAVPPPVPNAPIVVTVTTAVYDMTSKGGIGRVVGKIPRGTECVGDVIKTYANGTTWYEVPRSAVTLTGAPRSEKLVSRCAAG